MADFDIRSYKPVDQLHLWWLADPQQPRYIGPLNTVRTMNGVSLHYGAQWLESGFPLSEDLPLRDQEFLPSEKEAAAGAVDDARPDRWGERVIRNLDKPPRLSLLEFLLYAGDDRFGALGVSVSADEYLPRRTGLLPTMRDVAEIERLVHMVMAGEPVPQEQKRLIAPGVTMGGARPKALLGIEAPEEQQWVLKFAEHGETIDWPLVEHATMTLAAQAGIRVAETRPVRLAKGHAVAVKRFDRVSGPGGEGRRVHGLSAHVALRAAGEQIGYPELAQVLRRRGVAEGSLGREHMRELFRRLVFNILMDNTDDHDKNHVLLVNDRAEYELAPAFDVLPSAQGLGYQQMRVGEAQADSTLANALSEASLFGLNKKAAEAEVIRVAKVAARWKEHYAGVGVSAADIESLGQWIDRDALADQRKQWVA